MERDLFMPLLSGLAHLCVDKRDEVRDNAIKTLFVLLNTFKERICHSKIIFNSVIKGTLEDINCVVERIPRESKEIELYIAVTNGFLRNTIKLIDSMPDDKLSTLLELFFKNIADFVIEIKQSPLGQISIDSIGRVITKLGGRFTTDNWTMAITHIEILFNETIPELFAEDIHSNTRSMTEPAHNSVLTRESQHKKTEDGEEVAGSSRERSITMSNMSPGISNMKCIQ